MAEYQKQINDLQENLDKERRSRSEFEKKLREELKYTLENSMKIKYQKKLESLQMDNQELNSKANSYWNEIIVLETRLKDILNITSSSSLESWDIILTLFFKRATIFLLKLNFLSKLMTKCQEHCW